MLSQLQTWDAAILLWIQNSLRGPLDGVISLWSNLGEAGLIWILISLCFLARKNTRRAGLLALLAMGLCYLLNDMVIKNLICRPRPFLTVEGLTTLIREPSSWSCPSGHACSSLAAANVWWKTLEQKRLRYLLLALAVLMALSRLYVGVHYPTDVLLGALVGSLGARALLALDKWQKERSLTK